MLKVDSYLVELIVHNMPYEELVGYYEYSDEDIQEARWFISHTPPDTLLEMLEVAAARRKEEEAL